MKTIYKFDLTASHTIQIPATAKVLSCQFQRGRVCFWVALDTSEPTVERTFEVVGTGWEMTSPVENYVGTLIDGDFVWHIFEVTKPNG